MKLEVILDRYPYRFVQFGKLESGYPDLRIQKMNFNTWRWNDMYLLDSQAQLDACIEDREYVKWLDPDPEVAAYPLKSNTVSSPYAT